MRRKLTLHARQYASKPLAWRIGWLDTIDDVDGCRCPYDLHSKERRQWQEGNEAAVEVINFLLSLTGDSDQEESE